MNMAKLHNLSAGVFPERRGWPRHFRLFPTQFVPPITLGRAQTGGYGRGGEGCTAKPYVLAILANWVLG